MMYSGGAKPWRQKGTAVLVWAHTKARSGPKAGIPYWPKPRKYM